MCYKTLQIDGRKKEKREPNIKEQPMACSTTYFVQLGCAAGSERVTTSGFKDIVLSGFIRKYSVQVWANPLRQ
jgi:hypothetical protein